MRPEAANNPISATTPSAQSAPMVPSAKPGKKWRGRMVRFGP